MEKIKTEQTRSNNNNNNNNNKFIVSVFLFFNAEANIFYSIVIIHYAYVENYIKLRKTSAGLKSCKTEEVSVAMT
jgi:hypothetical protein